MILKGNDPDSWRIYHDKCIRDENVKASEIECEKGDIECLKEKKELEKKEKEKKKKKGKDKKTAD